MAGENAKVHQSQNPDLLTVESGGRILVKSGGTLEAEGGSTLTGLGLGTPEAAIPDLGTSGAGTADSTLQAATTLSATATVTALRDEINALLKPQLDNNFQDCRGKINAILAALRAKGIIAP